MAQVSVQLQSLNAVATGSLNVGQQQATFGLTNASFVGTLVFETTADGSKWVAPGDPIVNVETLDTTSFASGTTGDYRVNCSGSNWRLRVSAYTSGSVTATGSAGASGGGGSSGAGDAVLAAQGAPNAGGASAWPVTFASKTGTPDSHNSITTGGVSQTLFGGVAPANGYELLNPDSSEVLWVNDQGGSASVNGANCFQISYLGGFYQSPAGMSPPGIVSVYGATTAHKFVARAW